MQRSRPYKMAKQKSKTDKIVRCFEVSEPTLHQKGHTIYKIIQKLIPVDSPEKEVQQVVVWRRYNDIKKLYKAMLKLHNALYRKEEFPPFAAAKLFGRFEKEVIIERQRCAQDLLNFIAQRSYFVKSKAFQDFFQGAECSSVADNADILRPIRVGGDLEEGSEGGQDTDQDSLTTDWVVTSDTQDQPPTDQIQEGELTATDVSLGGVWQFRQAADAISLGGMDEEDENTDFTDDSTLSTPLPSADAAFFDPFHTLPADTQQGPSLKSANAGSNEWLLSTMEYCGIRPGEEGTPTSSGTPDPSVILDPSDNEQTPELPQIPTDEPDQPARFYLEPPASENVSTRQQFSNKSYQLTKTDQNDTTDNATASGQAGVQYGKGDLEFDPLKPVNDSSMSGQSAEVGEKKTLTIPEKPLPKNLSLLNLDVQDKGDYIFQAANQISLGQQCEASANYHMAFNYIRNGVGILLTGVQLDENSARREVVRRKTAKYLQRAEKLHKKYLDGQGNQNLADRWDKGQVSPTKLLDPQAACIEGPLSELRNYKVIGVIDGVMLVIDSTTDTTHIIKVLHKSSSSNPSKRKNIVPTYCPCMVKLHRFYETKYAIMLVLQHAPGGKLWNYIGNYLQSSASQSEMNEGYLGSNEGGLQYAGRAVQDGGEARTSEAVDKNKLAQHSPNKSNHLHTDQDQNEANMSQDPSAPRVAYNKSESDCVNIENISNCKNNDTHNSKAQNIVNKNSNCNAQTSTVIASDNKKSQEPHNSSPVLGPAEPIFLGHSPSQFQDLLQSTKPALEAFSVNSLDSESGPTSRYESVTSDPVEEVIQEVSENMSPISSPKKSGNGPESVFTEDDLDLDSANCLVKRSRGQPGTPGTSFLSETDRMLAEVDKELEESDRAFHNLLDTSRGVPHSHSTPSSKQVLGGVPEKSIYDYRRSPDHSSGAGSADEMELSGVEGLDLNDKEVEGINNTQQNGEHSKDNSIKESSSKSSVKKSDSVFRQVSQERSLETDNKPRNRSASGLSSVFDNLDMVSEDKRAAVCLPENSVRQWAAQVVTGLDHLHELGIVCRDLSPHNLLLGDNGNILLSYFSQWAHVESGVNQYALKHLYAAPEVLGKSKHSPASDWWSLGVLLFELFTGKKLSSVYPYSITSHTQLEFPGDLSTEAKSLLTELLKFEPSERLGAGGGGVEEIKAHPFFGEIDWNSVEKQGYS